MKKLSQFEVFNFFKINDCELIGIYTGYKDPINYKCKCGKIGNISLEKFKKRIKRKEGCFYCNNFEWTKEKDEILKEMYGKEARSVIADKLSSSYSSIKSRASFLKLKGNRSLVTKKARTGKGLKYFHDIDFFDRKNKISFYWAGFIASIGCINESKNSVSISLKDYDLGHLEKFQDIVSHTGVIHKIKKSKKVIFTVHSARKWIYSLEKNYNIISKKYLILKPPNNLNDMESLPYIVGYIDGSGSISLKENNYSIQIKGTEEMLSWIKEWFDKWCPPFYKRFANVNKRKNIFYYSIQGIRAKYILEKLLSVELPRLERKWN